MFGMTNSIPLLQMSGGGRLKITDFLENPVDIFTITISEVFSRLNNGEVLFGDFISHPKLNGKNSSRGVQYTGYIPITNYSSDYNYLRPLGIFAHISRRSNNSDFYDFILYSQYLSFSSTLNLTVLDYKSLIDISNVQGTSNKLSWYNTSYTKYYGKIWIGKFKNIIQE